MAFGHSLLAMSGEESLAQVNREIEAPKLKNLLRAGRVICCLRDLPDGNHQLPGGADHSRWEAGDHADRQQRHDDHATGLRENLVGSGLSSPGGFAAFRGVGISHAPHHGCAGA